MYLLAASRACVCRCDGDVTLGDPGDLSAIKHNDTDKAEILQHQFCRVFTREPEGVHPDT